MSLSLYMDHHIRREITSGLKARGVDVLTAAEDRSEQLDDPALLDRAAERGRVLFTQDKDFLREAARRQRASEPFPGVIYTSQRILSVGDCIAELELIAKAAEPEELANRVVFLPLR